MTSCIICSWAFWNDGLDAPRVPVGLGSVAAVDNGLDLVGTGVSGCESAAARRGRSVATVVTAAGVAAARGVEAMRGIGFPGGTFSSPGIGVATAT